MSDKAFSDTYVTVRVDEYEAKDTRIAELEAKLDKNVEYTVTMGRQCERQADEIKRLRSGLESEEPQEYAHNEVTGLHNMADLYEIERLRGVVSATQAKYEEAANTCADYEQEIKRLRSALLGIRDHHDDCMEAIARAALEGK